MSLAVCTKRVGKAFLLPLFLLITNFLHAQTTYTWSGGSSGSWGTGSNWTPSRSAPASNDILVFNVGGTVTCNDPVTQTIGGLQVSNSTIVNLTNTTASSTPTVTISNGVAGADLTIASGSQLNFATTAATQPITITLATGATGSISGNMNFNSTGGNSAHQLLGTDASSITFNSGATCTQGANSSGNLFGSTSTANTIVFASGSTFVQGGGSNPFGLSAPSSKVVFQTGSLYKTTSNGFTISLSGRTYANVEIAGGGTSTPTGSSAGSMDNLTVTSGTLNVTSFTGNLSVNGNISVAASQALNISPTSAITVTFNGSSAQTIANSGTLTFGSNAAVVIANSNGLTFNQSQTISGSTTVNSGAKLATAGTLTLSGTPAINGSFQINSGGWSTGGTWAYGASGTLIFNSSSNYGVNNTDVFWPTTNGPANVTILQGGITLNSANRTISGTLATSAGVVFSTSTLTINGTAQINSGGFFSNTPTYGSSSTLGYNTGGSYTTSSEWTGGASTGVAAGSGIPANLTIQNTGSNVTLNGGRGVPGNITVSSGTTLTLNATTGDLYAGGNFTMNGTLTNNNRAVFLVLGNAQALTSSNSSVTFDWLIINKTGASTVTLGKNVIVNNTFTLTAGFIDLSTNDLTVGAISGGGSSAYVKTTSTGQLKRVVANSSTFFPVGNSAYDPINLTNSGTSDTYGIRVLDGAISGANDVTRTINRRWNISEAVAGGSTLTAVATYNVGEENTAANFNGGTQYYVGLYNGVGWTTATATKSTTTITASATLSPLDLTTAQSIALGVDNAFIAPAPTIIASGGVVASAPGSGTSGYVGNTITVTGTNLDVVTIVKVGGSGGTSVSILSQNSTTLTFAAINAGGQIYVQNSGGNATSAETYTNLGYISTASTDWNTASTWLGNALPAAGSTVTIANAVTVSGTVTNSPSSLTINSGSSITISNVSGALTATTVTNNGTLAFSAAGILTIASGGTFANGTNTFTAGTGTVVFAGTGTVTGTLAFNNITVNGGLTFPATMTVNGNLQINGGGFLNSSPNYGSSSTLIYNTSYNIFNEWVNGSSGAGVPQNVTIQNNSTVSFNGTATSRSILGNLTIASGSTLALSTTAGGDLNIGGNFANSGTFTHNSRGISFNGTGAQSITAGATFAFVTVSNTGGTVTSSTTFTFANSLVINTGATLAIGSAGIVNNGTVFNVNGTLQVNAGGFVQNASPAPVYGSSSTLVYNTGNTGGSYGRNNEWTATGVGTIGVTGGYPNNVTITGSTLDIVNGTAVARAMAGNLLVTSGSFNLNAINSIVTIGGNLTTSGTGTVNMGTTTARLDVAGNVTNGGSLTLSTNPGGDLYVAGNLSNSGTFTHSARAVYFTGGAQTVSGNFTGTGATNGFAYVRINNGTTVTLGANINISNNITFNSGKLTLGTNNVTLSSGATITGASASNYFQTNSTGQLKQVVTTSPVSFPVGNSAYDPITLTNTGTSDTYGVYLVDGTVPDAVDATRTVNRRWVVSESVVGGSALTAAVLQYNNGEEGTNFNSGTSTYIGFYNGTGWYSNPGTIAGSNPFTATMTGAALYPTAIPANSYFTIAKDQALGSSVYDYYRSVTSGNWSASANWQSSPDNSNWYSASNVPGAVAGGGVVTIQNGHTITLDYAANPASLTIASGATVSGTDNTKTLKIGATGTGALDVTGTLSLQNASASATAWLTAGTLTIYNGGVFTNSVGNAAEVSIATFNINNGGTYNHDAVGSSSTGSASDIPGSTRSFGASSNEVITKWATGSLLNSLPALSYGNLTINVSTLGGSWNQVGNITNIQGDLNIISTGGGTREFRLVSSNGGAPLTLSIGGNLNVSGGTLSLIGSSTSGSNTSTVTVAGNVTVSGNGILDFNSSAAASISTLNVGGDLTVSGSGKISRGAGATSTLIFNKSTGTQNVTLTSAAINTDPVNFQVGTGSSTNTVALASNFSMNSGATMTVKDNATLQASTYVVSGGTFTMGSSTSNTLRIGSTSGITASSALGNIQTTTRNYSFGNYIYNGASSQLTGDGLPSTINSLTIANTGTSGSNIVVLSNSSTALTSGAAGALTLTSGYLSVGSNKNININSGGSIAGSGGDFDNTTPANSGTITFLGSGTVTGTVNFYPAVFQNGGMSYSVTSNIKNTITLNAGSFMTAAPVYGTGSTLIYNTGGTYNRNVEFGSLAGAGYPYNVTIQNGTTLDLSANGFANRAIAGDLVIGNGSAGTLSMGAMTNKLTVNGNISIGTASVTGTLTLSSAAGGNIEVGGNWTRTSNGTFTPNNRTVSFIGATNASVTASGGASFYNMTINKTSGSTVTLNNAATVSNALTFASGLAVLGSNDLTAGSISGGSATSYAIVGSSGTLKATFSGTQLMPVGYDATAYSPVTITNSNSMQWSLRLENSFTNYPAINQSSALQRIWLITPSTNPTAAGTTLDFEYPDALWTTPAQVNIYNYEPPNGWAATLNGTGVTPVLTNGMQSVTLTSQTTFSPFAITGTTTPLPVTLLRFSGRRENNRNVLKWTTATEINNNGFEVQRSTTGADFTSVGFVASQAANGNSQSDLNYTYTDVTSITKAYYRLKQTDIDGHVKYSGVVLLTGNKDGSLTISGVYPNPAHASVNINVNLDQAQKLTLIITDVAGRPVKTKMIIVEAGTNSLTIDVSSLSSGTYFIKTKTATGEERNAVKLVKQ